jgi:hypothetical protein
VPLAVLAWCALVVASVVVVMGPLSVAAVGLSISRPSRLILAGAVLGASAAWARGGPGPLLEDLARSRAPYLATLWLALAGCAVLLYARGAVSVGGADSAGYLAQAQRWRDGRLHVPLPLTIDGMPDAWSQSGLGLRPDATGTATVPTYPPGLPWLEALALGVAGEAAAVRAIPAAATAIALVAIWLMAVPRTGEPGAALAVVTLATLPPFLYQALQPMSDVPALAAWLIALALAARPSGAALAGAGAATTMAILIRPNLAPLALAVAWEAAGATASVRAGLRRRARPIAVAAVVGAGVVAGVQAYLYGSPLQSGYGRASELFAMRHIPENLRLYAAWLREALPWPALLVLAGGTAGLVVCAARRAAWRPSMLAGALTGALYLVYQPFDSWTYLRFVLVSLALGPLGIAHLLGTLQRSRHARWTFPVTALIVLAVALPNLRRARDLSVFDIRGRESRYLAAGTFVRDQLPPGAVIVAVQHSASAPYYSGRPVVRPDLLSPDGFEALVAWAAREHRPIAFVLDQAETDLLRSRFGDEGLAALDWPPRAEAGRPAATRVWVDGDRAAYLAGGHVRTQRVIGPTR